MPATLSIIANVFTDERERARAIALWAGVSGLGVVIGPLAGGYLLEHFWWGSIFLINVPVVILTIIGAVVLVPESKDAHAAAPGHPRRVVVDRRLGHAAVRHHRRPEQRLDRSARDRLVRRGGRVADVVRVLGASHGPSDPRDRLLRQSTVHGRVDRGHLRVLRHVRVAVLRQPVPAVRARLLGARVRVSRCCRSPRR